MQIGYVKQRGGLKENGLRPGKIGVKELGKKRERERGREGGSRKD
jgi:hypothetical protein